MFYVFGLGGPIYRGTMENLAELSPVRALSATRGVHRSDALHRDAFELPPATPRPPSNALHTRRNDAMAAYADAQQAKPPARQPLDRVQDVMSREVFSVPPDLTVAEAWETLAARGVGQAPVLDAQGLLIGLLLRADMMPPVLMPAPSATGISAWQLAQKSVRDIMLTPVPAVAGDTSLRRAARVLLDMGLPGLPVTQDDGHVIGFLSRADILRAVVADPPLDLWT